MSGAAAGDFGRGQGGEVRASPQRAVRTEPTQSTGKRPAARRVFAPKALWLRCSSVTERLRLCSFVAPRHRAFGAKTAPLRIFRQSLSSESANYRCKCFARRHLLAVTIVGKTVQPHTEDGDCGLNPNPPRGEAVYFGLRLPPAAPRVRGRNIYTTRRNCLKTGTKG